MNRRLPALAAGAASKAVTWTVKWLTSGTASSVSIRLLLHHVE